MSTRLGNRCPAFAVAPGATLEAIVSHLQVEVSDASHAIDFDWTLSGRAGHRKKDGWQPGAPASAWAWRYVSPPGVLPRVRAKLRFDPQDATRVQLNVTARRGGFASLAPVLPLHATVTPLLSSRSCAKAVYSEGGTPTCELATGGGSALCR